MNEHNIDLDKVAKLARIEITAEERDDLQKSLSNIIDHMDKLFAINVDGIEPSAHAYPLYNVLRDDVLTDTFSPGLALQNAPKARNQLLIVPKVIE